MANYIGYVNEYAQKTKVPHPVYTVIQNGPAHNPIFTCTLKFKDLVLEETAHSSKGARYKCAEKCVDMLNIMSFLNRELTNNSLQVKLFDNAFLPSRASEFSAGYDLRTPIDVSIKPWTRQLIKTNLAIKLPSGTYGRIAGRSGLSFKHSIDVGAGVIDEDYTGIVGVILCNNSSKHFFASRGDKIAQLIVEKIAKPDVVEVTQLPETERGDGGFGSTGQ